MVSLLCIAALALVFYPGRGATAQGNGGGGGGQGGGEETTATNLSYPAHFFGAAGQSGTIGSYSLGASFPNGMSYGCLVPEMIGTTTYPNTSCVDDQGNYLAPEACVALGKCPNLESIERIYWQKNTRNTWLAGYAVSAASDSVPAQPLPVEYIDWGDNLEVKSWPVQNIRVETNTFSTLAAPAEGASDPRLRFDMWHVFGQGTNELWGVHATNPASGDPTPYYVSSTAAPSTDETSVWPYGVNVTSEARLNVTKLAAWSAACPATATGVSQSPFQGEKNLTWIVDDPNTGIGHWIGAALNAYDNLYGAELNIKGSYVYGYNWNLNSLQVPQTVNKTGWWRLTFYTPDKSVDFSTWKTAEDAGYDTLAPPPEVSTSGTSEESSLRLYVPQVDATNQLTYIDVCITGGVPPADTATALVSSPSAPTFGTPITLTAKVTSESGTPTGAVTFLEGTTTLDTVSLDSSGTATFYAPDLPVGDHPFAASYSGDANFASSTSSTLAVTVAPAPTTTALASSANSFTYGAAVTLTATVTSGAGTPTGEVTFSDGATALGTGEVDTSGVATFTTALLGGGSHSIGASYGGDTSFATSTSATLAVTVTPAGTSSTLTASANPIYSGEAVTFTAAVASSAGTPKGDVTFMDGSATLASVSLDNTGHATHTTSALSAGSHLITAAYAGSADFATSTSPAVTQTINPADFTLAIPNSSATIQAGQSANFAITVTPRGNLTTAVSFSCSGLPPESGCSFTPASVTPGTSATQAALTISTTAPSTGAGWPLDPSGHLNWPLFVALALLTFLAPLALRKRNEMAQRKLRRLAWAGALALAFGLALSGCGGGSSPANPYTPPGTYSVTVTGTSGSQSIASQVSITVQ